MPSIDRKRRRSRALSVNIPDCLGGMGVYTVNLVSGCAFECAFCKFRANKYFPFDRVVTYSDIANQLAEEVDSLRRRGQEVRMIIINPSSDAFFGDEQVDDAAVRCLDVLLSRGIFVNISTRGILPREAVDLLAAKPNLAMVTVNISSPSESFKRIFEPRVPSVAARLSMLQLLHDSGIPTRGRIEPLIPMENDTREQLETLLSLFKQTGVRDVVVSFLQMSPDVAARLREMVNRVQASMLTHWFKNEDGQLVRSADREYRRKKYEECKAYAAKIGMRVMVCACRNADMYSGRCYVVPERLAAARMLL